MNQSRLLRVLHLTALGAFAVAQPLFEVLSSEPVFFVARRSMPIDIITLAVVSILLVPTIAAPALWLADKVSGRLACWIHLAAVAGLTALVLSPLLQRAIDSGDVILLCSGLGGVVVAGLYARIQGFRSFFTILIPAPLIFAGLFLLSPSLGKILFERGTDYSIEVASQAESSLVMVLLDELPLASLLDSNDQIDAALFPNFARLAGTSTWFRNATASHTMSEHAVPAILTGMEPVDQSLLPIASDHSRSIFTLLEPSHRMKIYETFTALTRTSAKPFARRMGSLWDDLIVLYGHIALPESRHYELPPISGTWGEFRQRPLESMRTEFDATNRSREVHESERRQAEAKTNRSQLFREFIDSIDGSKEPTFYFLHILSPHSPWNRIASGKAYRSEDPHPGYDRDTGWSSEEAAALNYQRHLLQLGHVDSLLGELLQRLEHHGILRRSLVVLAADHGCTFQVDQRMRGGSQETVRDILHIPLFFKLPQQTKPRVSDRNVESFDILPTIADALGVEVPWPMDGQSALDTSLPERETKTLRRKNSLGAPLVVSAKRPDKLPGQELKLRFFGSRPGWEGVYAMGPRPDLLDRRIDELVLAEPIRARVSIFEAHRFNSVDVNSGTFSGYIEGSVSGRELPRRIAIAVNDQIRVVTVPHTRSREKVSFAAMLPESALAQGANRVEVYAVLADDRLSPIPMSE